MIYNIQSFKNNFFVIVIKVNRVLIFSENGRLKNKFDLSEADFPNSIAVNQFKEIFVTDNNKHCVHVSF